MRPNAVHLVGYENASQLSREYRRMCGAPQRAEIQRTREAAFQAPDCRCFASYGPSFARIGANACPGTVGKRR